MNRKEMRQYNRLFIDALNLQKPVEMTTTAKNIKVMVGCLLASIVTDSTDAFHSILHEFQDLLTESTPENYFLVRDDSVILTVAAPASLLMLILEGVATARRLSSGRHIVLMGDDGTKFELREEEMEMCAASIACFIAAEIPKADAILLKAYTS